MGVFFSVIILIKEYDYNKLLEVADIAQSSIARLEDMEYYLKDIHIHATPNKYSWSNNSMYLTYNFSEKERRIF